MTAPMKPLYRARTWPEERWWLIEVTGASEGADPAPVSAMSQADSRAEVDAMTRDLIATVLDVDESEFDVEISI